MTYLLWTLLNFALLIFFITVCFRATKIIKENLGTFAVLVFVLGLLSFVSKGHIAPPPLTEKPGDPTTFQRTQNLGISPSTSYYVSEPVAKYVGSSLNMNVSFIRRSTEDSIAASKVEFSINGLVGGHQWEPILVQLNRTPSQGVFHYVIGGDLKWTILGIPLYTQHKTFFGLLKLK